MAENGEIQRKLQETAKPKQKNMHGRGFFGVPPLFGTKKKEAAAAQLPATASPHAKVVPMKKYGKKEGDTAIIRLFGRDVNHVVGYFANFAKFQRGKTRGGNIFEIS